jgi:hypothetical protein
VLDQPRAGSAEAGEHTQLGHAQDRAHQRTRAPGPHQPADGVQAGGEHHREGAQLGDGPDEVVGHRAARVARREEGGAPERLEEQPGQHHREGQQGIAGGPADEQGAERAGHGDGHRDHQHRAAGVLQGRAPAGGAAAAEDHGEDLADAAVHQAVDHEVGDVDRGERPELVGAHRRGHQEGETEVGEAVDGLVGDAPAGAAQRVAGAGRGGRLHRRWRVHHLRAVGRRPAGVARGHRVGP